MSPATLPGNPRAFDPGRHDVRVADAPFPIRVSVEDIVVASLTVENYVKTIHLIAAAQPGSAVTTGQVATALEVSPGTVTSMLKTLDAARLATHRPYEGVALTKAGRLFALRVIRRHRLLELFLLKTLDLSWDEVHDEAEHMEHAVSDLLVERIDAFLGHPRVDPHGDPIPPADGADPDDSLPPARLLADCTAGSRFRITRVLDQSPGFLRSLTDSGLVLGVEGDVVRPPDGAGLMSVSVGGKPLSLSTDAATKLVIVER
jgi:DtxR family Mn-dependent transcriptional regulator